MSTATEAPPAAPATEATYKAAILAGEVVSDELLQRVGRIRLDVQQDLETIADRRRWCEELAEAARLQSEADKIKPKAEPPRPMKTLAEAKVMPQPSEAKLKWHRLRQDADAVRQSATINLARTCDPEAKDRVAAIQQEIQALTTKIGNREDFTGLEDEIAGLDREIADLEEHGAATLESQGLRHWTPQEIKTAIREKSQLRLQLIKKRESAIAIERLNKSDRKQIAALEERKAEAREAVYVAENMLWSESV